MTDSAQVRKQYHCVVGHRIPADAFEEATAVWTLDRGAEVRVCLEHGAPVAVTVLPAETPSRHGGDA